MTNLTRTSMTSGRATAKSNSEQRGVSFKHILGWLASFLNPRKYINNHIELLEQSNDVLHEFDE